MEVVVTEDQESSEGEEKRDEKKNRTAPQWESKLKNLLGKPFDPIGPFVERRSLSFLHDRYVLAEKKERDRFEKESEEMKSTNPVIKALSLSFPGPLLHHDLSSGLSPACLLNDANGSPWSFITLHLDYPSLLSFTNVSLSLPPSFPFLLHPIASSKILHGH